MNNENEGSRRVILHAEDNAADARLLREGLSDEMRDNLIVVTDGAEALRFLEQEPPYEDAPRPQLVILDLNLPKRSGLEVLEYIKTDDDLRTIPVIVLTSSNVQEDIETAYRRHANAYLEKPMDIDECKTTAEQLETFWLQTAILPNSNRDNE